jgi:hypothetical protein
MGVGMPATLRLQTFGEHVLRAFGHVCYHVGSSLEAKDGWRDVDVRLILPDEEYERMGLGDPLEPQANKRWVSLVLAWSAFGKESTDLPIDFQIQQQTVANAKFKAPRSALFMICDIAEKDRRIAELEAQIAAHPAALAATKREALDQCIAISKGCKDFGGGYRTDEELEIFHRGIQTVTNCLEALCSDGDSYQLRVVERIGRQEMAREVKP